MPRSVNAVASRRRRRRILKLAKGYFGRKKNVWTVAKNQVEKGWTYAYRDRRNKKREWRKLWIQRINAAARIHGASYSQFMGKLNASGIALNRKVLADLAMNHADAFKAVFDMAMSSDGAAKPKAQPKPKAKAKPKAEKKPEPAPEPEAPAEEPVAEAPAEEPAAEEPAAEAEAPAEEETPAEEPAAEAEAPAEEGSEEETSEEVKA